MAEEKGEIPPDFYLLQEGVPFYFGIMQAVLRVIISPENEPVPWQGVYQIVQQITPLISRGQISKKRKSAA